MVKKAQSIVEYTILFAIIIAALVVMQVYVKRAYQGRLRHEADSISQQYSPGHMTSTSTVTTMANSVTYTGGNAVSSDMPGVITSSAPVAIEQGVSVTVSNSNMTTSSTESVDSLSSERLYKK
jgi:uncharacterized protein (UPF0333 family)